MSVHVVSAHLKGVIDPTGSLPENKVFISGYATTSAGERELFGKIHRKIFLTRSPSVEPEDAKVVSVVGSKPREMSADDWSQLCSYEFGTIVFPKARRGSVPLPCIIAGRQLLRHACFSSGLPPLHSWRPKTVTLMVMIFSRCGMRR